MRRRSGARCAGRSRIGGPLTETAATGWRSESKIGAATQAFPRTASWLSMALPTRRTVASSRSSRCGSVIVYGVSGFRPATAGAAADPRAECDQYLAQCARVGWPSPAGPRRQRKRVVSDDLDEVQHFVSVEDAEVNGFVR